jgi:hypothetical protein
MGEFVARGGAVARPIFYVWTNDLVFGHLVLCFIACVETKHGQLLVFGHSIWPIFCVWTLYFNRVAFGLRVYALWGISLCVVPVCSVFRFRFPLG